MKKNILLLGGTQVKHVEQIFKKRGWHTNSYFFSIKSFIKSNPLNILKWISADVVYIIGGFDIKRNWRTRLLFAIKKNIIIHWIGTDVLRIMDHNKKMGKNINKKCINLSGSELLQSELEQVGINSNVVPIVPIDIEFSALSMPNKHEILSYIPEEREEFYGISIVKRIALKHPDIKFHIVANNGKYDKDNLPNVYYEGFLNKDQMRELYSKCSILIRYPQHDGLSMMLLEALGTGKSVLYKYSFPYVHTPKTENMLDIEQIFKEMINIKPQINYEAINFVNSSFSLEKQLERYLNAGVTI